MNTLLYKKKKTEIKFSIFKFTLTRRCYNMKNLFSARFISIFETSILEIKHKINYTL